MIRDRQRIVLFVKWRNIHHVRKERARMMLEPGGIFAQAKVIGEDTLMSGAIGKVAGADFFPARCLELYPLLVDLDRRDFGLLARHGAIVHRKIMQIGIDILTKPMVLVAGASAELKALPTIVRAA